MMANNVLVLLLVFILTVVASVCANEASFYDPDKQRIIRGYKDASNTLILEARKTDGSLEGNARININGSNPTTVAGNVSSFSLAYNTTEHKAYILYPSGNASQPTLRTLAITSPTLSLGSNIVANSLSFDYGNINPGESADHTITLTNRGTAPGFIGEVSWLSGPFILIKDGTTCNSNQILQPNAQCTIVVRFAPTTNGQFNASLSIGSINISLNGNGGGGQSGADVGFFRIEHDCWANDNDMVARAYLRNYGTSPAQNFTVTVSIQRINDMYPTYPPMPEYQLATLHVDVINPNEEKIVEKTGIRFNNLAIHFFYYVIFRINLNDSDVSNNVAKSPCMMSR